MIVPDSAKETAQEQTLEMLLNKLGKSPLVGLDEKFVLGAMVFDVVWTETGDAKYSKEFITTTRKFLTESF